MIVISGSSGFLGQNLMRELNGAVGISLRDDKWRKELNSATIIINLVGKAHDHNRVLSEKDYIEANVQLTKELFKEFLYSPADLMIHISSIAAVEELESTKPLIESDLCNPTSLYGKSKRAAEKWLLSQELPGRKKLVILRPPMIYGPGDKGNLGLLYKIVSKRIPYPLGSYNNNRSFMSIYNFIYFINQIIKNKEIIESGIYHIADDESISTSEIIMLMKKITGKKGIVLSLPKWFIKGIALIGDVFPIPLNSNRLKKMTSTLTVSNSKIKRSLGILKLPLTVEEGMVRTFKNL